jgi:pyruvate formate lyase activating enzyme
MVGRIHSLETLGALDGPGLRTVIFLQGCPLRCKFCHNVDSTLPDGGEEISVDDLVARVLKNRPYWGETGPEDIAVGEIKGGVTISGGDPVFQPEFAAGLLKRFKAEGVHTTIESSFFTNQEVIDSWFPNADFWMVSIKHMDEEEHKELTGVPGQGIKDNLQYVDKKISEMGGSGVKIRIRFVVIPTITDSEEHVEKLAAFVSQIKNLESLELLPYSTIGRHKWIELYGKYELDGVREGNADDIDRIKKQIRVKYDFPIKP